MLEQVNGGQGKSGVGRGKKWGRLGCARRGKIYEAAEEVGSRRAGRKQREREQHKVAKQDENRRSNDEKIAKMQNGNDEKNGT